MRLIGSVTAAICKAITSAQMWWLIPCEIIVGEEPNSDSAGSTNSEAAEAADNS